MKILLVDDDPIARSIHSMLLSVQGHEVLEAADGELAWQMVKEGNISFVVSDWLMPNLAGVDLCRRIRAADFDWYVYVILCTSKGAKSDLVEGMDAGADDFLVKPISPEEFRVKVRAGARVLSLQQGLTDKNRELARINGQLQSAHKLVEDDLKAAAWMQQRLLPQPAQEVRGLKCEWRLEPSGYIAGDIFNLFSLDDTKIGFYLLDVCGHGVPAAMLSVTLSMMLTPDATQGSPLKRYNRATGLSEVLSPADAVHELNRRFQFKDDRYFTMIYGMFDIRNQTLKIAQAGHPGPVLIRQGAEPEIIGSGGMPIGLWPAIDFDFFELSVRRGDRILLYSDGVTEGLNEQSEAFGEQRLLTYIRERGSQPLKELLEGLLAELKNWCSPVFADDISLLAIEIAEDRRQ
ncbi:PP2C family protein-serine/threonine phosphatase [Acidicapsa acidisoli]|uniref:PP2C family protein-serine/threonine phosphatase n=1 Tax=Acidicapsa acidisoli TaxID=1615681 RepID=UPI0021DF610E|nr:SpoIIE family protein phosphatase [Acidicapsa acidisoli]